MSRAPYFQQAARQPGLGVAIMRPPNRIFRRWEMLDPELDAPAPSRTNDLTRRSGSRVVPMNAPDPSPVGQSAFTSSPSSLATRPFVPIQTKSSAVFRSLGEKQAHYPVAEGRAATRSHESTPTTTGTAQSIPLDVAPKPANDASPSVPSAEAGELIVAEHAQKISIREDRREPSWIEVLTPARRLDLRAELGVPLPAKELNPKLGKGVASTVPEALSGADNFSHSVRPRESPVGGPTLHIGTIEVRIVPSPNLLAPIAMPGAPRPAVKPSVLLSRGFASRFGWTQG